MSIQHLVFRVVLVFAVGFTLLGTSVAVAGENEEGAEASSEEECPTWFPDFRCERSGRYDGFVMPMGQPYIFEDPFITTGLYLWGVIQETPGGSAFGGGMIHAIALQARVAITDRLAFIATKDGYTWTEGENRKGQGVILKDQEGFNNITGGFKYALIDRPEDNFILSPSFRIEIPTGQNDVYQGFGDSVLIPAASVAWGYDKFHFIGDLGGQIPMSSRKSSGQLFSHMHFDYALFEHLVPLMQISVLHYTSSGEGSMKIKNELGPKLRLDVAQAALGLSGFEGGDVVNLGSPNVKGDTISTLGIGARIPLTQNISTGVLYEWAISDKKHIIDERATLNLSYEF